MSDREVEAKVAELTARREREHEEGQLALLLEERAELDARIERARERLRGMP